jgi:hypothetical protein
MQRFQDRIEAQLEQACAKHGFSATVKYDYSNVGTIHVHDNADSGVSFAQIGFDFQSISYKLTLTINGFCIGNGEASDFWHVLNNKLYLRAAAGNNGAPRNPPTCYSELRKALGDACDVIDGYVEDGARPYREILERA